MRDSGQGSNSVHVRQFNERVILSLLRRLGQASKADLARHANLTNNTAGVIVQALQAAGLIRTDGKRRGERGQPATLLTLDPAGAYAIGVKIGRRSLDTILVDFMGTVLDERRHERSFPWPEEAIEIVVGDVAAVRASLPPQGQARLAGLGIATPYSIGSWLRQLDLPADAASAWEGVDIAARLGAATGLPALVENDGTAAATAELLQGGGRELNDFLYIFIGGAIGGGIVTGGECRRGLRGNAGDVGLMPVGASRLPTAPAPAGPYEILLTRASINALVRHLRGSGVAVPTPDALDGAIAARADLLEAWLDDCADALVAPLLAASSLLDIEAVVLDGDLPRRVLQSLADRLERLLAEAAPEAREPPSLRLGRVGRQAAAIGAAILPLNLSYGPSREILLGHDPSA